MKSATHSVNTFPHHLVNVFHEGKAINQELFARSLEDFIHLILSSLLRLRALLAYLRSIIVSPVAFLAWQGIFLFGVPFPVALCNY